MLWFNSLDHNWKNEFEIVTKGYFLFEKREMDIYNEKEYNEAVSYNIDKWNHCLRN